MREARLRFAGPLDLPGTLGPQLAAFGDPTLRLATGAALRASRTPDGPAALEVALVAEGELIARAWGDGAGWLLERVPDWLGFGDAAPELPAAPAGLRELARRARGVRLSRTHRVFELLVPIVLAQLVSGAESSRAFRNLVRTCSEPAPGPHADLWLPVAPARLCRLPAAAFPALGVLERQGRTLQELGFRARRLEEADAMTPVEARRRLCAFPGIGPWSAASAQLHGMGDADAVPIGDYHLPSLVAFQLAGEERADDARMLALLAPFAGQRGRVIRWIAHAGQPPPRRGPRGRLRALPREGRPLLRPAR